MKVWRWYRARRWWWQVAIASVALPLGAAALYVSVRSLQYLGAERDAGLYLPKSANVVVRVRNFEAQWERIGGTVAWRAVERRVLRDRATRRSINGILKDARLPTLDDLEDERKAGPLSPERIRWLLGRDALAALQVGNSWKDVKACGVVGLPWSLYLVSPFASWVYPRESIGGRTAIRVRRGKMEILVHFTGSLAVASNDRSLLEQALRKQGRAEGGSRPVELRVEFERSPALEELREAVRASGLLPHVRLETVRAVELAVDVAEAAVVVESTFVGAETARPDPAPHQLLRLAPVHASGVLLTQAGIHDVYQWLRSLVRPGAPDPMSKNAQQALDTLDGVGKFSTSFLPLVEPGMAIITGGEAGEGRVYPAVAMVFPTKHPREAMEAMDGVVKKIAGKWADEQRSFFEVHPVEDTEMHSWKWPGLVNINDFLRPCYAAAKDVFILGNNERFTEAVIRAASSGAGSLPDQSHYRALLREFGKRGFTPAPDLAGGFLSLPAVRASLDGLLARIAGILSDTRSAREQLLAEMDEEYRRRGVNPPLNDRAVELNLRLQARARDQEDLLRANLIVLESMKWCAFESRCEGKGIGFRWALEFR